MQHVSKMLGIAMIVGATSVVANAAIDVDGYTWDFAYTGDALPTASSPAWTTGGAGAASVSSGVLNIDTTTNDGKYFEINRGGDYNPTTVSGEKAYIQFRAKVNSEVDGVRFATQIYIAGQAGTIALNLGEFGGNTGVFDNASNFLSAVDLSQWHTYRVELDANAPSYRLWIDDFNTSVASGTGYGNGGSMYFGDGSGDTQGNVDFDYIAWTNTGAPVAVPEPAFFSVVMLGAGILTLRKRA